MTARAYVPGCCQDCPCQQVRALSKDWPVFSSGAVGVLVEPADNTILGLRASAARAQGRDVRYFQWSYPARRIA